VAVAAEWSGGICAEPVAAGFALRIDALHGETGQVLHCSPLVAAKLRPFQCDRTTADRFAAAIEKALSSPCRPIPFLRSDLKKIACQRLRLQHLFGTRGNSGRDGADSDWNALWCQEKRLQDIVVRLRGRRIVTGNLWKLGAIERAGGRGPARQSRGCCLRIKD
jgi:hypothetical protein